MTRLENIESPEAPMISADDEGRVEEEAAAAATAACSLTNRSFSITSSSRLRKAC